MPGLWVTVIAAVDFADGIFVSLLRGLAGPVSILRVVVLDPEAHIVEVTKLELSSGAALLCSAAIPLRGLGIAARYALAKVVKVREPLLSVSKALRCRQPIPVRSFGFAGGDSFSFLIHEAEVVLCPGQIPIGGALAPFKRAGEVASARTPEAQIGQGIHVPQLCRRTLPACGLRDRIADAQYRLEFVTRQVGALGR